MTHQQDQSLGSQPIQFCVIQTTLIHPDRGIAPLARSNISAKPCLVSAKRTKCASIIALMQCPLCQKGTFPSLLLSVQLGRRRSLVEQDFSLLDGHLFVRNYQKDDALVKTAIDTRVVYVASSFQECNLTTLGPD